MTGPAEPRSAPGSDRASWTRLKQVFGEAAGLAGQERVRHLDRACAGAPGLRAKVEAMLAADELDGPFLVRPSEGPPAPAEEGSLTGLRVDRYRIGRRIGKGGMGEVYAARRADREFEQRVALKVLKRGIETESVQRRFAVERRVLASLDHPGICRLLDAGALPDGRPYLVMERIDGEHIDAWCDRRRLSVAERLVLFRKVCAAVQFAHGQLVVHRDLKPANVLVTPDGQPKLLDFGIAKLLDEDGPGLTARSGWDRPMTPEYASPEQIAGGRTTTATDVYALGVLLYELLTGHPPFVEPSRRELEQSVVAREPLRPSTAVGRTVVLAGGPKRGTRLTPGLVSRLRGDRPAGLRRTLSGDLDNIVMMALRKEPGRRYASVDQLSEDVRRFLDREPVLSRRPTWGYRARKFVQRNRTLVAAAAAVTVALAAGVAGTSWKAVEAARARDAAFLSEAATAAALERVELESEISTEVSRFLEELLESAAPGAGGRDVTVREVLVGAADRIDARFDRRPEVRAAVRAALARTFVALGELDLALAQVEAALETLERTPGVGDRRLADGLVLLGTVQYARGEPAEATRALERALEVADRLPGEERATTALILNNLGAVRRMAGDHADAEALFREALAIREELAGRESLDVAESLNNLSGPLRLRGATDEAAACLRESLRIRRALLDDDHPLVLQSLSNLAVLHASLGELEEAEPLLVETVARNRRVLGPEHPDLAVDLSNLASVLRHLGRDGEAASPLAECLEIRRAALPEGSALIALTALQYGELLVDLDRHAEARPLLLEIEREVLDYEGTSVDHGRRLLEALARTCDALGDGERAAYYRRELTARLR